MKEGQNKIHCISFKDKKYPKLLRQIADPPSKIYYRGDLDILDNPTLAVVGSRKYTEAGKLACQKIIGPLVDNSFTIITVLLKVIARDMYKDSTFEKPSAFDNKKLKNVVTIICSIPIIIDDLPVLFKVEKFKLRPIKNNKKAMPISANK